MKYVILACHSSQNLNHTMSAPVLSAYNIYIKPTYVVTMPEFSGVNKARSSKQKENEKNLKENYHSGQLSKKSMSKLRNAINWLCASAKYKRVYSRADQKNFWFKVNFITLTIPPLNGSIVSEKVFKKALHAWLVYAQKYFYLKNYVWKIEAHEDKRLHVHLCTDTFIHYNRLRQSWNATLNHYGLLDYHFEKFGNRNPNSTDVHATRKVNDLAAYLCEYMVKKPSLPATYKGRIWGCNRALSHHNKCYLNVDPTEMAECMRSLSHKQIRYAAIESPPDALGNRKKIGEIFFINTDCWSRIIKGKIKEKFDEHRFYIRQSTNTPPLDYYTVEYFSEKNVSEYREKSVKPKQNIPCETKTITQKTGTTQLGLWS